jgi:uncharacterized membrane protein YdcZ (DUF606 family)
MSNFRYGGYLLIALGLINLRYHTGYANNFQHSALIVIPGLVLLGATFFQTGKKLLLTPAGKVVALIIVISGALFAALNK